MPEGDTVWRTARQLHDALAGLPLTHAELRVPRHATADLAGRVVTGVVPRGKHLLTRIEPDLTLHTHLGMDGSWQVRPAAGRRPGAGAWRVRVLLANARWLAAGSDLSRVDLVRTANEDTLVGHLGPDLLGDGWDDRQVADAAGRLAADPARPIAEALLDQRNLAGAGNVYQAEVLFGCGVHPATPAGAVPDLHEVVRQAHELLSANRASPMRVTTGDRRPGRRSWVYRRAGRPCLRCGTAIASAAQGPPGWQRITFWCPRCQPAPAADA